MNDLVRLEGAANKTELAASRKLVRQTGIPFEAALRAARDAALALRRARHEGAPTAWRAWFDGSAKPNPGRCGIGARLQGPNGELVELSQAAGYGNSSEAEYRALILVLETALAHGAGPLTVYGDSQVVINDVNGGLEDSALVLRPYRERVHALLARLPAVTLRWVPRHKNLEADALSQRASASPLEETDDSTTA